MTDRFNIALALQAEAARGPDRDAIIAEDLTLSYAKLWLVVERFAAKMQAHAVSRNSLVGIDTTDMVVSVASIFALSMLGAAYTIIDRDFVATGHHGVTHFFRSPERKGLAGLPYIVMDETWSPKFPCDVSPIIRQPGFADPTARCWVLGSSGTTGRPKYVSVDQQTVWNRVAVVQSDYTAGETRLFVLFGCNSRPFGIRAVAALLSGNTIIDSHTPAFLAAHGVNFVCGSPKQLQTWLADHTLLPRIPRVQLSGARVDETMILRLLDSFDLVEDVYGSSETIAAHINATCRVQGHLETLGRAVASEIEIVDTQGMPVAEGLAGEVRIRNGHMVTGYDGLPEETARRFRDGWFYPGDIARWEPDGVLRLLGRADDVVNLGGFKLNLGDLDAAMVASPLVAFACCFVDPSDPARLAVCLQPAFGAQAAQAVRAAWLNCARAVEAQYAPATILVVPQIALTQDGVPRRKLAQALFAQTLGSASPTTLNETLFKFEAASDAPA
jgi:acyl-CoA synthetase (AMP-forming)/AMP-acid ligase II